MTENEFHSQRLAFAIFNDGIHYCPMGQSHHEWLVDSHIMCEEDFNTIVRGYIDNTGLYFYQGDFETNKVVEAVALEWCDRITQDKPVYCGAIKGKVGERWRPIKRIK